MFMSRVRFVSVLLLLVGVSTGCMHVARVFLAIPEETEARPAASDARLEGTAQLPRPELPPPDIESLTRKDSVLALLPSMPGGGVDWVVAWREGTIRPRRGMTVSAETDSVGEFSYDVYLSDSDGPEAFFPHSTHREWLGCESCHPGVYRGGVGSFLSETAHEITSCGYCHGSVAFPIQACEQCHEAAADLPTNRREKRFDALTQLERMVPVDGEPPAGIGSDLDLTGLYPPAQFPHDVHRLRYQCRACHERPFPMVAGATVMTQDGAHSIEGCGSCHDGLTAFGAELDSCEQCHIPSGG